MRRYFICAAIFSAMGVAVAFVSPQSAGAFVADGNGAARAATATNTMIEVKHPGTPPGWHHGRKEGWRRHHTSEPPGLAKKP